MSFPQDQTQVEAPGRSEKIMAGAALLAVLAVRIIYIFRYRVDSDEPQHLHVAWQWSQSLVAYRDFFDNHAPLFHLTTAPLLRWLGERSDILDLARLFMVPLYLLALCAVHLISRELFSARTGLWAPILVAAVPNYMFPTIEFRADNLWAPLWLLAMAVIICGKPSLTRSLLAGFLAGMSLAASLKTGLLAGTLSMAALVSVSFVPSVRSCWNMTRGPAHLATGLAGFALVPALLTFSLVKLGAWERMKYCIFQHNLLPPGMNVENRAPQWVLLGCTVLALIAIVRWLSRKWGADIRAFKRSVVLLQSGLTLALLEFTWPVLTRQNYLPVYPLIFMFLVAGIVVLLETTGKRLRSFAPALGLTMVVMLLLSWTLTARPINVDHTKVADHLIIDALRLTKPDECVMSYKGEAVFRRRPYYYVLEPFTRCRLANGLLTDNIAEHLIETQTMVAMTNTRRLPPGAKAFIEENYLPTGPLRVAGKQLPQSSRDGLVELEITIPASYTLVGKRGETLPFELDGCPVANPSFIGAGRHSLKVTGTPQDAALIWSRAHELGFKIMSPNYEPEKIDSEF